ncbi:MAG: hypothetical protein MUE67_06935 [Anaerolineales bacterium]|jgi:hypothetical protein|nr:hypothetical protein [Anaerolineales bacterium]
MESPFSVEVKAGSEVQLGNYSLLPFTRTWQFKSPGMPVRLIWNRPNSILVRDSDGNEKILPIIDLTWRVIGSLVGICLSAALLLFISNRLRKH